MAASTNVNSELRYVGLFVTDDIGGNTHLWETQHTCRRRSDKGIF